MKPSAQRILNQPAMLYDALQINEQANAAALKVKMRIAPSYRHQGIDSIQKSLVIVNLLVTNICLFLAFSGMAKVLLLSTAILAALAAIMGLYVLANTKKTESTAEACVLALCSVYVTFFTILAACASMASITMG